MICGVVIMNDQRSKGKLIVLPDRGKDKNDGFKGKMPALEMREDAEINRMLVSAVQNLEANKVEEALKEGGHPGLVDPDGNTLLHSSCYKGNYEISRLIIEYARLHNIDIINVLNKHGKTPMDMVLDGRRPDSAEHSKVLALLKINKGKWHSPDICFHVGNIDEARRVVERLLTEGMSSELIYAAAALDIEYAKLLLRNGAEINPTLNKTLMFPTHPLAVVIRAAVESGLTDNIVKIAQFFVNCNAKVDAPFLVDVNRPDIVLTLMDLTRVNNISKDIKQLLRELYDRQLANKMLFAAAYNNNKDMAESAIRKGARIDARNEVFATPSHIALAKAHLDFESFIIEYKPDLTVVDNIGATLIHAAAFSGEPNALNLLITAMRNIGITPDLDAKDDFGNTPAHVAAYGRKYEMIGALKSEGADLNLRNDSGETLLHIAVEMDDPNMGGLLLELGMEVTDDVIEFAEKGNKQDIADALRDIKKKREGQLSHMPTGGDSFGGKVIPFPGSKLEDKR